MGKKRILVTGANGQLGSELRDLSGRYPEYEYAFTDYQELSITDEAAVKNFFDEFKPDYCVNCAAYTAVDKAEDSAEYNLVEELNATAVAYLAEACTKNNVKLIHISTDYVFEGNGTVPYKEDDATRPESMYGITKLKGEQYALKLTDAVIIRTAWVYSAYGKNFVKTMMRFMQEKPELNVVSDQYGTPTYAADLAAVIMQIIVSANWQPGIYHYTNDGTTNWYEFAIAIKETINADCLINAVPTAAYPTAAKRPSWSVLDKSKIKEVYDIKIPDWKASLRICISKLND